MYFIFNAEAFEQLKPFILYKYRKAKNKKNVYDPRVTHSNFHNESKQYTKSDPSESKLLQSFVRNTFKRITIV